MQQDQLLFALVAAVAPVPDVPAVAIPALKTIGRSAASPNLKKFIIIQNYCHVFVHIFSFR